MDELLCLTRMASYTASDDPREQCTVLLNVDRKLKKMDISKVAKKAYKVSSLFCCFFILI